ncbi:MAG: helix-turn-helix domain-containing protein [Alphaproteobacteria bacterium]|nr:helix-turn-helix domain-containing protein [Alphaproteobacteria bacterium]
MSKIPQGEWNAIAARYQSGESISQIARSYGCTPPAIHYILKRNRQQGPEIATQPTALPPAEAAPVGLVRAHTSEPTSPAGQHPDRLDVGSARSVLVRARVPEPEAALAGRSGKFTNGVPRPTLAVGDAPEPIANLPSGAGLGRGSMTLAPVRGSSGIPATDPAAGHETVSRSAPPPGLDNELHLRAEAAIALFRSSFDAALAEGSPSVRERLRQAASDLMRVAARTTIVLDRLNAGTERSTRAHNYPRSPHAAEDFGKFG